MVLFAINKRVDYMKKTEKIKKNYEFRAILNKGKYLSGKNIECFYITNKEKREKNLIGIAISSKIAKANKRNRAKRLIREAYKNTEDFLKTGKSFVFLWKKNKEIEKAIYEDIQKDIIKIMKEMKNIIDE